MHSLGGPFPAPAPHLPCRGLTETPLGVCLLVPTLTAHGSMRLSCEPVTPQAMGGLCSVCLHSLPGILTAQRQRARLSHTSQDASRISKIAVFFKLPFSHGDMC